MTLQQNLMLHYCPLLSLQYFPQVSNLFFQINATSNKGQNQTMAKFQEYCFLFLYTLLKFIYSWSMPVAVNLLIQKENSGCCVNTDTYGKVLCEYNFCCDLQGEVLIDIFSNNVAH